MTPRTEARTQSNSGSRTLPAVIAVVAAVAAALAGVVLVAQMTASRSPVPVVVPPGQEAQADGLSLKIDMTEWIAPEMTPDMPDSAMAGMPAEGEQRLSLAFTLTNDGGGPRDFSPANFSVRSSSGGSWPPFGSNFVPATIGPGQALNGSIFFHVPEGEPGMRLVWTRGNTEVEIPVGDSPIGDQD